MDSIQEEYKRAKGLKRESNKIGREIREIDKELYTDRSKLLIRAGKLLTKYTEIMRRIEKDLPLRDRWIYWIREANDQRIEVFYTEEGDIEIGLDFLEPEEKQEIREYYIKAKIRTLPEEPLALEIIKEIIAYVI